MKRTISELRAEQVKALANMGDGDLKKASKVMNSFYRYTALRVRNVELSNSNAEIANSKWLKEEEEKEERWRKRLEQYFAEYGLMLVFYGIYPTITNKKGGNDVIYTYYY